MLPCIYMATDIRNISLRIELKNNAPLELNELVKSLSALSSQYESYAAKEGFSEVERSSRLYIREIKSGSVIMDLVELASAGIIPYAENINTIIGFGSYIKVVYDYLSNKTTDKIDIDEKDLKDLSQIISPIANDNGSQYFIHIENNGVMSPILYLDSKNAKAIQETIKEEVKEKSVPQAGDVYYNALMVFYQTRNKVKDTTGDKVIIDDVVPNKALNVVFANQDIKKDLLQDDANPYHYAWQVDVKVKTVKGKIVAYEVLTVHDKFKL